MNAIRLPFNNKCLCPVRVTRQYVRDNHNECSSCGKFLFPSDASFSEDIDSVLPLDTEAILPLPVVHTELEHTVFSGAPAANTLPNPPATISDFACSGDTTADIPERVYSNICVCGHCPGLSSKYCTNCGGITLPLPGNLQLPAQVYPNPPIYRATPDELAPLFARFTFEDNACPATLKREIVTQNDVSPTRDTAPDSILSPVTTETERILQVYSDVLLSAQLDDTTAENIRFRCPQRLEEFLDPSSGFRRLSFSELEDPFHFEQPFNEPPPLQRYANITLTEIGCESINSFDSTFSAEHTYSSVCDLRSGQIVQMEQFTRTYGLRPPRFEARKSDIIKFFSRYDKFVAQNPNWDDAQKVTYLANLLDDEALDFFDELPAAVRADYENLKIELLEHYKPVHPPTTQWSLMTKRQQLPNEGVTEYYDALLRLAQGIHIPQQQFLFIFLDGLPEQTKTHIALAAQQPENVRDALHMAKTFQAVTNYIDPAKKMLKSIKDNVQSSTEPPLTSTVNHSKPNESDQLDSLHIRIDQLSKQLNKLNTHKDDNFRDNRTADTRHSLQGNRGGFDQNPNGKQRQPSTSNYNRDHSPHSRRDNNFSGSNYDRDNFSNSNTPHFRQNNFSGSNYDRDHFYNSNPPQSRQNNFSGSNYTRDRFSNQNYNRGNFPGQRRFQSLPHPPPFQRFDSPRGFSNARFNRGNNFRPFLPRNNPRFTPRFQGLGLPPGHRYGNSSDNTRYANHASGHNDCTVSTLWDENSNQDPSKSSDGTHIEPDVAIGNFDPTREYIIPYDPSSMLMDGKLADTPCKVLFDTGSEVTLLSKTYYESLKTKSIVTPPRWKEIKGVNGDTEKVWGQTRLPITFDDMPIIFTFQIVDNIGFPVVLGRDEIDKHVHSVDFLQSTISFGSRQNTSAMCSSTTPNYTDGNLLSDVVLAPNMELHTHLCSPGVLQTRDIRVKGLRTTAKELGILCHDNLSTQINPHGIPCTLMNFSSHSVKLPKGTTVARIGTHGNIAATTNTITVPKEVRFKLPEGNGKTLHHDLSRTELSPENAKKLEVLLDHYRDGFAIDDSELRSVDFIQHHIDVGNARPIRTKAYRVNYETQCKIDDHIQQMLANGIIEHSVSPWASPVLLVNKKDQGTRFCVDYRKLNAVTVKDAFPLPHIEEILNHLGGAQFFTSLDLKSGFFQVGVHEQSRQYTAFICKNGLYQFRRMPYGLSNNPSTFSRVMEAALHGLNWKICINYLDDIIVYSKSFAQHLIDLEIVFERLRSVNLALNPKKCNFAKTTINFLGHVITPEGIKPNDDKIIAVQQHPTPRSKKELQSFLGLVNYYRKYIPHAASILEPLNTLLRKDVPFQWTPDCTQAFELLKEKLTTPPILGYPDFTKEFILSVDACGSSIGFVLSQKQDNNERVIAYAGRSLNKNERNYSINELEALAVIAGVMHFDIFLYGRKFKIYTDNNSVMWLYRQVQPKGRIARWIMKLQGYDFDIIYKPGKMNSNADGLSRIPNLAFSLAAWASDGTTEKETFATAQRSDPHLGTIIDSLENPGDKSNIDCPLEYMLDSDNLLWVKKRTRKWYDNESRLMVPDSLKHQIMTSYHDNILGGHRGFFATYTKIRDRFFWNRMYSEIRNYCKTCENCAKKKVTSDRKAPLRPIPTEYPFQLVGMDVAGPFPKSDRGNRYLLVLVDSLTKWAEVTPLKTIDAEEVAKALYESLICRHGTPEKLLTDCGTNFTSVLLTEVCKILNISKIHTTPYHPAGNGLVERFNGTLIRTLAMYVCDNQSSWDLLVPGVTFGYHCSTHQSTLETPFYLLYGRRARLPNDVTSWPPPDLNIPASKRAQIIIKNIQLGQEVAKFNNEQAQIQMKARFDKTAKEHPFAVGDKVLLRNYMKTKGKSAKFSPKYKGPYTLTEQLCPVTFRLGDLPHHRMSDTAHVNRMKPFPNIHDRQIIPPPGNPTNHTPHPPDETTTVTTGQNADLVDNDLSTPSVTSPAPPDNIESNKPSINAPDIPSWQDIIMVLNHRNRNQRLEFLIKRVGDDDSLAFWEKDVTLKGNPRIQEYLNQLDKPNTRSKSRNTTALVYTARNKPTTPLKTMLFHLIVMQCLISQTLTNPDIGTLYDCSIVKPMGSFILPIEPICNQLHGHSVHTFTAEVRQYRQSISNIKIYHCFREKVTLTCKETFFGIDTEKIKVQQLPTDLSMCQTALRSKVTPYGKLKKVNLNSWVSTDHKAFNCKWMTSKSISFLRIKLDRYIGQIYDEDPTIIQDLTDTTCNFTTRFCRPQEKPLGLITWFFKPLKIQIFNSLGHFNITRLHNYIVIPTLSIGGSIIRETENTWLLDVGYLVIKMKKDSTFPTNKSISDKFLKFSKDYVMNTKSNVQRELGEASLTNEMIWENKMISSLATMNCQTNQQLHLLQILILKHFPDVSGNFIFPHRHDVTVQTSGDALLLHSCRPIKHYNISWTQQVNITCYHLFPVQSKLFEGTKFLELTNRRIVATSHKIRCGNRPPLVYIKDIHGAYWEFVRPYSFHKIAPRHIKHRYPQIRLPMLVTFSKKLIHYKQALPHRTTLLHMLSLHQEDIEVLSNFRTQGNGNIILGLTRAMSDTFDLIGGTGAALFHSLVTGIAGLGNTTEGLIDSSANGIATIFSSIGIPNLVLYILNFLIIAYLGLQRMQPTRLRFLFPPPGANIPSSPDILYPPPPPTCRTPMCTRHLLALPPPIQPHVPVNPAQTSILGSKYSSS